MQEPPARRRSCRPQRKAAQHEVPFLARREGPQPASLVPRRALSLAVLIGFLLPNNNGSDNPLPSTYLAGQHGARAAYDTLLRANYPLDRWERPLGELAATAGPDTVVIFAEPFSRETTDIKAVRQIVERGGRVLSTGFWGGFILPSGEPDTPKEFSFAACQLEPEGLDPLANSGEVWMVPEATWQVGKPTQHIQYSCAGQPAVVEYDYGKGHVVWWASSTPLENSSLARANNLDLLLNSLGPREGTTSIGMSRCTEIFGRIGATSRTGSEPVAYRTAGAGIADRIQLQPPPRARCAICRSRNAPPPSSFLRRWARSIAMPALLRLRSLLPWTDFAASACGCAACAAVAMGASELATAIRKRFPKADASLDTDLIACEEAIWSETIEPRQALKLIQKLHLHQERLTRGSEAGQPDHAN